MGQVGSGTDGLQTQEQHAQSRAERARVRTPCPWCRTEATLTLREQESIPPAEPPSLRAPTLYPILRSSHSWEQPLSFLLRHSLMKQLSSSEPSVQSLLLSQSSASGMHFPFLQRKKESLHLFSAAGGGEVAVVSVRQPGGPAPRPRPPQVPGLVQRGFLGASSEWSWQSNSPSHSHCRLLRQRPLAQRNSWGPQVGYSAGGWRAQTALPTFPSQPGVTGAPQSHGMGAQTSLQPPQDRAAPQGPRKWQIQVVLVLSKPGLCQGACPAAGLRGTALLHQTPPAPPSSWSPIKPLLDDEDPFRVPSQHPADPAWLPGPVPQEIQPSSSSQVPWNPPHSGDSSEPSPQSSSWSQTKCLGMHWRFPHMNSRSSHVLLYTATRHRCQPPARLCACPPSPLSQDTGDKS